MATPTSYHVSAQINAGAADWMKFPRFTAASDANAISVAVQLATIYQISLWLRRTDNPVSPTSTQLLDCGGPNRSAAPASPGSALGNQVTGVAYSPF